MAVLGLLVVALAVLALLMTFLRPTAGNGTTRWLLLGAIMFLMFQFLVLTPYKVRKTFESRSAYKLELSCVPSESGLTFSNAHGNALIPWSDFAAWKESKHLFLLYVAGGINYILPKRFFVDAVGIEEFRRLLQERLRAK